MGSKSKAKQTQTGNSLADPIARWGAQVGSRRAVWVAVCGGHDSEQVTGVRGGLW